MYSSDFLKNYNNTITIEERLRHYLNHCEEKCYTTDEEVYLGSKKLTEKETIVFNYKDYKNTLVGFYCTYIKDLRGIRKIRNLSFIKGYRNILILKDFIKAFRKSARYSNHNFLLYMGEHKYKGSLPVIRKARKTSDQHSVLFKLGITRHFLPCYSISKNDCDWKKKKTDVIWRGATTSATFRNTFVCNYFEKYNVGFSSVKQFPELIKYKLPKLSLKEQLKYKFIISLEGYDVASNLKWILTSNSIPIMPKPTWVSWIMEDKLEPYVHYLPLNEDLSNLDELIDWATKNDDLCKLIAENGKKYMAQFFDKKSEKDVMEKLLTKYSDAFQIERKKTNLRSTKIEG